MTAEDQETYRITKAVFEAIRYADDRSFLMTRTKLLKLLYLTDLHAVDEGDTVRSEVNWVWHHYGPFDKQVLLVEDTLHFAGAIERTEEQTSSGTPYRALHATADPERASSATHAEWDREFFALLHRIIDKYGDLSPSRLTTLAYETPPLQLAQEDDGQRGGALDMSMGLRRTKKTSSQKLRRLRSLRNRRKVIKNQSDQGDLSLLGEEISETAAARSAANREILT